jgi:hypothetical protein
VEIAVRLLLGRVFRPLVAWAPKDGPDAGAGDARGFYFGQNDRSNGLLNVHFCARRGKTTQPATQIYKTNPVPVVNQRDTGWSGSLYGNRTFPHLFRTLLVAVLIISVFCSGFAENCRHVLHKKRHSRRHKNLIRLIFGRVFVDLEIGILVTTIFADQRV